MIALPLRLLADFLACRRFYSRLPVTVLPFEAQPYAMLDFSTSVRVLPFAGFFIGGLGGLVLWGCSALGLQPLAAGAFAIAFLLGVTRALLTAHFLSDVLIGGGIGLIAAREVLLLGFPGYSPVWF